MFTLIQIAGSSSGFRSLCSIYRETVSGVFHSRRVSPFLLLAGDQRDALLYVLRCSIKDLGFVVSVDT